MIWGRLLLEGPKKKNLMGLTGNLKGGLEEPEGVIVSMFSQKISGNFEAKFSNCTNNEISKYTVVYVYF